MRSGCEAKASAGGWRAPPQKRQQWLPGEVGRTNQRAAASSRTDVGGGRNREEEKKEPLLTFDITFYASCSGNILCYCCSGAVQVTQTEIFPGDRPRPSFNILPLYAHTTSCRYWMILNWRNLLSFSIFRLYIRFLIHLLFLSVLPVSHYLILCQIIISRENCTW